MTQHDPAGNHSDGQMSAELADLLAEIVPTGGAFRHREHIHLAFLAVQRYGVHHAPEAVAGWLRHIAAYERAPQKFNATMTRAWTEIVAHHATQPGAGSRFDDFAQRHVELFDKRLLARHYSSRTLASTAARTSWVAPDLRSFPWQARPSVHL